MHSEPIASLDFTSGGRRPVFQADDGGQYVLDHAGYRVYGRWVLPKDEADSLTVVKPRAPHRQ